MKQPKTPQKKKLQITVDGNGLDALSNGDQKTLARLLEMVTILVRKTPEILNKTISDVIDENIEEDRQIRAEGLTRKHAARQPKANQA